MVGDAGGRESTAGYLDGLLKGSIAASTSKLLTGKQRRFTSFSPTIRFNRTSRNDNLF
jgi:hypothetical protein